MISALFIVLIFILIATPISILWVRGIDYMKNNHPDYKGEDFLNWDEKDIKSKVTHEWDDNKIHAEGDIV